MKKIVLIFIFILSFANEQIIKNLIGEYKFETFNGLLEPIIDEENVKTQITYLISNGLLKLKFNYIKTIHPTFVFKNPNPIFDTKILYKNLKKLGYYYFYPIKISKDENYSITLEMKSIQYINPVSLINLMEKNGCNLIDIKKEENFTYFFNCEDRYLTTYQLSEKLKKLIKANGVYFISPNGFNKIEIKTSKLDFWYPYIVFYDENLNIISITEMDVAVNSLLLDIPEECAYIKITDNFTKENFKRGILVKGIK